MPSEQENLLLQERRSPIPVTILTGFLGSGKTTLVNHVLGSHHGLKVAVIVNEFGDVSIDDKLISRQAQDIIELANGCICCSMQGDLLKAIHQVTEASNNIEYVLLETSGLSDPLPVAASIMNNNLGNLVRLDGIVTVVDALNFDANLEHAEIAFNQLVNTDLILINKIDLVDEYVPEQIQQGIQKINRPVRVLSCVNGKVDIPLLLDVNLFELKRHYDKSSVVGNETFVQSHGHNSELSEFDSISFESNRPIEANLFRAFIDDIPSDVYRGKGILNIAEDNYRHIFQLVGERSVITRDRQWTHDEERKTHLILIGRRLNDTDLQARLSHLSNFQD